MERPLIILADTDEAYLLTLMNKFLNELGDTADMELISSAEYFSDFFSRPRTVDTLILTRDFYTDELRRHNISHTYLLTEDENPQADNEDYKCVFKYSTINELFFAITEDSFNQQIGKKAEKGKTQIIAFFSAAGGSGKTAMSLSFAANLAEAHQKVFYVSTESVQNFQFFLKDASGIPGDICRKMLASKEDIFRSAESLIRREGFYYFPPMLKTPDSCGIREDIFERLVSEAADSGAYRFIVTDIEAGLSAEKIRLLERADHVILVTMEDAISAEKTRYLFDNLDIIKNEKYILICNKSKGTRSMLSEPDTLQESIPLWEMVPLVPGEMKNIEDLKAIREMKKLAYAFV